ncbi:MAG: phosphate ABC transporter permease PstA [Acidimicrobiales bacterium]
MTAVLEPELRPSLDSPSSAPTTTIPQIDATPLPPHDLRRLGGVTRSDVLDAGGAAVSALAAGYLIFGRLTPLWGPFGQVLVTFALFVAIYALLTSLHEDRPAVVSKVMTVMLGAAGVVAFSALASVIGYTLYQGRTALFRANLYFEDMSETGPLEPLSQGGIKHAIVGTLVIISLSVLFTVPLGLVCAVYMNETRSRLSRIVRTVVDAMTALPSIVAGLFIFAFWVLILGFQRSGLAASLAVSVMMLPIIIRSADVVLRLVPGNLREASAALGAPQWRTVWRVVLPTARPGLATAIILGVARGIGETAPVLLTSGVTASINYSPFENAMMSLPLATFEFARSPQPELQVRGFATAAVLMVLVLGLFALARMLGGRPVGQLSKRQSRRAAAHSARDVDRFESLSAKPPHPDDLQPEVM